MPISRFMASLAVLGAAALAVSAASAQGVLDEKQISLALAQQIAQGALDQCRKDGYRVSIAVLNRAGQWKAFLREDGSSPHTVDTSFRKAYTAVTYRQTSAEFAKLVASAPERAGLKDVTGVITLGGGVPIKAGNEVIGSIGVSGSPGGEKDEACAMAGIAKVADQLK